MRVAKQLDKSGKRDYNRTAYWKTSRPPVGCPAQPGLITETEMEPVAVLVVILQSPLGLVSFCGRRTHALS
jgi:hypothetical protein